MASSGFVDETQIHMKAGNGGAGAVAFRREAHVDKGGPDGGNGGDGGSVWLVADRNTASLLAFRDHPHREATSGTHGSGKARHGAKGVDNEVRVPVGTVVKDRDGTVLADLSVDGARWVAARGGRGGRGNASFLSQRRRAPAFAEQGEYGEEFYFNLELKLMADVALVGFPNAGKSTFISRVSAAKPKIANYPFTTLEPHLGVVTLGDGEFVIADIPGLIEGAGEGKGLGHKFLRHIERARVLLILIDLASIEMSPEEQQRILLDELQTFNPDLLERPRVIVGSRLDAADPDTEWDGESISAVTGANLNPLLGELRVIVDEARATQPAGQGFVIHRPEPAGVVVSREENGFTVHGRDAQRAIALNDLTNYEAMDYVQGRLRRLGVYKALARAGARSGDSVNIGDFVFSYEPDD